MGLRPCRAVAYHPVGAAIAVAFLIGLVHYVDAVEVAEFIQILPVGIVAGAQEIDIGLLHHRNVLFVGGVIHVAAGAGVMVVAVHAAQLDILAIEFEDFAHTLHALDAQMVVEVLHYAAFVVGQFDAERIEIGLLGRPKQGLFYLVCELDMSGVACSESLQSAFDGLPVDFQDCFKVLCLLDAGIAEGDIGCHLSMREVSVGFGSHLVVGDVYQRTHPQLHFAIYAA